MLTNKQEAFVIKYLETGNATEAYRHAYNTKNSSEAVINNEASLLLKHREISIRVKEHRQAIEFKVLSKTIIDKAFITDGILRNITAAEDKEDHIVALKGYDMLSKMYDLNEDKQNDRLFTGAERLALVENFKKRMLDVTPKS